MFGACLFSILMVQSFDQTNSGSSCYLLTEHPNAMKITHLLQNKFYFVVIKKRRAWIYRTDPQVLEDNSEHFRAFCLEKHFSKANEPKKAPKCISDRKVSGLFLSNEHQFIPWQLRF